MLGKKILAIVGPTAVGKSALAVELAKWLGGEVVSADSRLTYRYMDIGTAKPTAEERAQVPHHLVDILDPDEGYSLALFLQQARQAIEDILARSKLPIVAGGTGQYVWGLLEGWQVPEVPPDRRLRSALEARARSEGVAALHEELAGLDPAAARRVDPMNPRRVVRALEVLASSADRPPSPPARLPPPFGQVVLGLTLERSALYRRIDARVDAMLEAGLVEEVERLLARGYSLELPSMSGMGYREIGEYLSGAMPLADAVAEIKRRTRRFSRKQHAWFRLADERIRWFQGTPAGLEEAAAYAEKVLAAT